MKVKQNSPSQPVGFIRHLQNTRLVTVGLAAICDVDGDGYNPKIVFCADRLVSAGIQYESGIPKIRKLTDHCYAMQSSTDSRLSGMILENAINRLQNQTHHRTIAEIVNIVKEECIKLKQERISRDVLDRYNFVITSMQAPPQTLVSQAMEEVNEYEYGLECEFIILGFDAPKQPHIYRVDQDGNYQSYDSVGFAHMGSGGWLTVVEMTKYRYSIQDNMTTAISRVYLANKVSERAEGVGRDTDFHVLFARNEKPSDGSSEYHLVTLSDTIVTDKLDEALTAIRRYEAKKLDQISQSIYDIIYSNGSDQAPQE